MTESDIDEDASVLGKRARNVRSDDKHEDKPSGMPADDEDDDDDVGPMPMPQDDDPAVTKKKRKGLSPISTPRLKITEEFGTVLPHERTFLDHLPNADQYYKSFMHREQVNFCVVTKYS